MNRQTARRKIDNEMLHFKKNRYQQMNFTKSTASTSRQIYRGIAKQILCFKNQIKFPNNVMIYCRR